MGQYNFCYCADNVHINNKFYYLESKQKTSMIMNMLEISADGLKKLQQTATYSNANDTVDPTWEAAQDSFAKIQEQLCRLEVVKALETLSKLAK